MSALLTSLVTTGIVALVSTGFSFYAQRRWVEGWESRYFVVFAGSWTKFFLASSIIASTVGAITAAISSNVFIGTLFGVLAYTLVIPAITDFKIRKVPKEITSLGIFSAVIISAIAMLNGVGTLGFILYQGAVTDGLLASAFWTGFITVFFIALLFVGKGDGMGLADFKVLWMVGFSYVWVLGVVPATSLFLAANLFQLAWFATSKAIRKDGMRAKLPLIPALSLAYIVGGIIYVALLVT